MSVFRCLSLCVSAILCAVSSSTLASAQAVPISGQPVSQFASLDTIMENLMTEYSSPASALAISYNGKLVYARGYGYAEVETNTPMQPDTIMRWASNSKPLTAMGIYTLIQSGKLTLSTQPFKTIFTDLTPPSGTTYNTQLNDITIQDLLLHTGGWDDTEVPDPVFEYEDIAANAFGDAIPATPKDLISYMLSQPLQHTPGSTYAYSNLGYIVLGQVISKVCCNNYTSYETYMASVYDSANLNRIQPAQTFLNQQLPDEAAYYDYPGGSDVTNVYDPDGGTEGYDCSPPSASCVPYPYGGYSLPLNHANGGWAGSAIDLVREWDIMNGQITPAIITNPSIEIHSSNYYPTSPVGEGYIYTFFGSLPGTNSLVHLDTTGSYGGNLTFGAVFNTRNGSNIEEPESDATTQIGAALQNVTSWPGGDLFTLYTGKLANSCSFKLASTSASVVKAGGTGSVSVTDANYCAWVAISNSSWITVKSGALNSNSGSVGYSVAANTGGSSRSGTISIAGQTFTITEAGNPASTTTFTVSPNPAAVGQNVTLTAKVTGSGGTPTGTVSFEADGQVLAKVSLSSGTATIVAPSGSYAPETYPLTAVYSGDSNFSGSTSATVNEKLNKAATTTTLVSSASSVTPPADVTLTATVKRPSGYSGTPGGSVSFYDGTTELATIGVNSKGVAALTASTGGYPAGNYSITAKYNGDGDDSSSTSSAVKVTLK